MRRFGLLLLVGLALLAGAAATVSGGATQAKTRWVITDLGTLGGLQGEAEAMNERGQIVGWSSTKYDEFGEPRSPHAFLWQNGKMIDLSNGGPESSASGINKGGQVVGHILRRRTQRAFRWQSGKMIDLGTLGGPESSASDINDHGQIVGWADTKAKTHHAFLWQNGRMRDLGTLGGPESEAVAINERGQVVGVADTKGKIKEYGYVFPIQHAFLWQDGRMRDLGATRRPRSEANDINERGEIVGRLDTKKQDAESKYGDEPMWHAFLWQDGNMRDLTVEGPHSFAGAINERSQVVGSVTALGENQDSRATLWQNGKRIGLGTLGFGSEADAINVHGQAVGWSETRDWNMRPVLWTLKRG